MLKQIRIYQYALIIITLFFLTATAFSQDLGSSSGLFKKPKTNKAPVKPAPKKAAVRPKTVVPPKPVVRPKTVVMVKKATPKVKPTKTVLTLTKPRVKPSSRTSGEINPEKSGENAVETSISIEPSKPRVPSPAPSDDIVIRVGDKSNSDFNETYEQSIARGQRSTRRETVC